MNLKLKNKFFLLVLLVNLFIPYTNILAADNCRWVLLDVITHPEDGTIISQSGGCSSNQKKIENSEASKICGPKPAMKGYIGGSDTHECCCDIINKEPQTVEPVKTTLFKAPDLKINIPGMEKLSDINCAIDNTCEIPWLGQYIKGVYYYAIAIAGILAAVVMMGGGLLWLISRGDASQITKAKELIFGSIVGLVILLGSYLIFSIVNPNLVNLKNIKVVAFDKINLNPNGSDSELNITTASCNNIGNDLQSIKGLVSTNASDPRLTKNVVDGLKKAIEIAKRENVTLHINSAFRTYEVQKSLWDKAVEKYGYNQAGKYVANPRYCTGTCYGHCAGVAVDICIKGTYSCSKIGGKTNANYSDDDVKKLQKIMQEAGWFRYCGEWWHFQYSLKPGKSCSP